MILSRFQTKPRAGAVLNWAHPLARELLARYLFNEGAGTSLFNLIGSKHATLSMDPTNDWVGSIHGGALDFDGVDDFGLSDVSVHGLVAATLIVWFRTATSQTAAIANFPNTGVISGFAVRLIGVDAILGAVGASVSDAAVGGTVVYNDSRMHQIALTYDGVVSKLYFDGVLVGSTTTAAGTITAASNTLNLGRSGPGGTSLTGQIDDVRAYRRALSAEEMAWLYTDPYATERFAPWAWYLDRTHAALEVELELNGVGNGWTDVSADLMLNPPPSVDYGIPGAGPLDLTAETGRFSFALNNGQGNSANLLGYYSPEHANVRSGFALGIGVRCRTYANSVLRTKFVGKLDFIDPMFGQYRERKTLCMAVDWLDEAAKDSP